MSVGCGRSHASRKRPRTCADGPARRAILLFRKKSLVSILRWGEVKARRGFRRSLYGLLASQVFAIARLVLGDGFAIAIGINPDRGAFFRQPIEFADHIEVESMGAEEDVAMQGLQSGEGPVKIGGDLRVRGRLSVGSYESDSRVRSPPSNDHDVEGASAFVYLHRPGSAATGMAGSLVGGESGATQGDGVVVAERAVHPCGRKALEGRIKVRSATSSDVFDVPIHDFILRAGFAEDFRSARHVNRSEPG